MKVCTQAEAELSQAQYKLSLAVLSIVYVPSIQLSQTTATEFLRHWLLASLLVNLVGLNKAAMQNFSFLEGAQKFVAV